MAFLSDYFKVLSCVDWNSKKAGNPLIKESPRLNYLSILGELTRFTLS
jgi:hypothetical protein